MAKDGGAELQTAPMMADEEDLNKDGDDDAEEMLRWECYDCFPPQMPWERKEVSLGRS